MLRRILFGLSVPAMVLGALLMSTTPTFAQRHGGGSRGGSWSGSRGGSWGGGYRGGSWDGYRGGYGGYGWGGRGWGGFGLGYGLGYLSGSSWGYPGYGYGGYGYGYPGYYAYSYPSYGYGAFDYGTPAYGYPSYGSGYVEQPNMGFEQPSMEQYSSAYSPSFSQPTQDQNTARIDVRVPANAQLWFDGTATHETGSLREFVSPPLQPGQQYTYTLRARWMQNGQPMDVSKRVDVAANERRTVDFLAPSNATGSMPPANFGPNAPIEQGNAQFNANVPPANAQFNTNVPPANAQFNTNVPPANTQINPNIPPANGQPNANVPSPNLPNDHNVPSAPNANTVQPNNPPAPPANTNGQSNPAPRKTPVP